ncbi:bifunctional folylpolyglutamate synthase/dihydrofolate synthase [Candidatus Woesearchaeota archaeon]|nr:bifunctional folylpolyglutamate synthase/dihydrofolate synthase [Candidatus Woesearchaeota archaeon]
MQLTKLSNKSLNQIFSIERKKKKFNLNKLNKFLDKIDHPEKDLKVIHVAGTNGKGSVCAMINSVLQEAGYKVGMFTSPHLIKINERFRINNKLISDKKLSRLTKKINQLQKQVKIDLSFFETLTVIAYLYFKEKNPDYVILETGLGGRLDATNTCNPVWTIITNVSLEHTEVLGNTITKITKEKAGIIKNNVPVITNADKQALKIIKQIAKKHNSKIIKSKNNVKTNLKGIFQLENAKTASTVLKQLKIKQKYIKKGLNKVIWPGRLEKKQGILLDGAHNPAGIKALMKSINNNLTIIFGAMQDKNIKEMAKFLKYKKIILTKANIAKTLEPNKIRQYFKEPIITTNLKQAIKEAKKHKNPILITGSIYLVGEAYSLL